MALARLNNKIFILIASLLSLTSLVIIFFVWVASNNHIEAQLKKDLNVAEEVFKQVLKNTETQLYNSAQVLTADFGFKQAVATGDKSTIDSVLKNHGERIAADLMALTNLDGQVISSTDKVLDDQSFIDSELINTTLNQGGNITFFQVDNRLYQVILLTVDAPRAIAVVMLGFAIDRGFVHNLKEITKLDIVVNSDNGSNNKAVISSLSQEDTERIIAIKNKRGLAYGSRRSILADKENLVSKLFFLEEKEAHKVSVALVEDINSLYKEFNLLHYKMLAIMLISLAIALFLVLIFSRKLTLPLAQLVRKASAIAKGEYDNETKINANSEEIDKLVSSFDQMQTGIREREERIRYQASHDLLTNIYNRFSITHVIEEEYKKGKDFYILGLNVIGFRGINDVFGYQVGDACIKEIAYRLKAIFPLSARLNGSEMIAISTEELDRNRIQSLRKSLVEKIVIDDASISFDLALCQLRLPDDADSVEDLFRRVGLTLDQARKRSFKYLRYDSELEKAYLEKLTILKLLKQALTSGQEEFSIVYQPKLHCKTSTVVKSEALLRWNSKAAGFVSPELFIPIAEQAGLIHKITEMVFLHVIADLKAWKEAGIEHQVAINLSVYDIDRESLLPWMMEHLQMQSILPSMLSFEITESEIMKDPRKAMNSLQEYRQAGFSLAIDDFGTGYSSLSYLKYMPISELKIDKSFILNLDANVDDQNIVQTIMSLANNFDLEVVAEGVETQESLTILKQWGCDWIQGYYISRPIPANELKEWLIDKNEKYG